MFIRGQPGLHVERVLFKFVVDGVWRVSPDYQVVLDLNVCVLLI